MLAHHVNGGVEVGLAGFDVAAKGEDYRLPAAFDGEHWIVHRKSNRCGRFFHGKAQAADKRKLVQEGGGAVLGGGFDEVKGFFLKKGGQAVCQGTVIQGVV